MDLSLFNEGQKEAVLLTADYNEVSDILILAGAGSGKTRVLVYRIANLLNQNVDPTSVLSLTFTKKAANEMQSRLNNLVDGFTPVKMSTFHSLAADILRTYSTSKFDIIDKKDQNKLIKMAIENLGFKEQVKIKDFNTWFSYQRNRCLDPAIRSADDKVEILMYRKIAVAYKKAKLQIGAGVLDFDDLLENLLLLLESKPKVKEQLHDRWKYILVDEYQDTNRLQFNILKLLRADDAQLLQVGDEDQLIYSWRGAEIEHIMASYKESMSCDTVRCVVLNVNYRCSANILRLANLVVNENSVRTGKGIIANKDDGPTVKIAEFHNSFDESDAIASIVNRWNAQGVDYSDIAILMRSNMMARSVERALIKASVPYKMHNGVEMFESLEVRLLMSLLKFTDNPKETFFFQQILETVKMGIGAVGLKKLDNERKAKDLDWISFIEDTPSLIKKPRAKELVSFFKEAKEFLDQGLVNRAAKTWLHQWDLMQFYKEEDRDSKTETLMVLFSVLEDYEHSAEVRKVTPSIIDFQEQRLLNDSLVDKDVVGALNIMTIHKSKGLEFKRGFILGAQDGVFPRTLVADDSVDSEEERRLAYVAITRFMDELVVTKANDRIGFDNATMYSSLFDKHLRIMNQDGGAERLKK